MPQIGDVRREAQEQKLCLPNLLSTSFSLGSRRKVSGLVPAPGMGPEEPKSLRSHEPCSGCKTSPGTLVNTFTCHGLDHQQLRGERSSENVGERSVHALL